jgi:hypothetical protein
MDMYTDEEKDYHTDIIRDAIETVEKRKVGFEFSVEEHIDMLISYDALTTMTNGMEDLVHSKEYTELYNNTQNLARYLIDNYHLTGKLLIQPYYEYCKMIEQMIDMIAFDSAESQDELAEMFQEMTVCD